MTRGYQVDYNTGEKRTFVTLCGIKEYAHPLLVFTDNEFKEDHTMLLSYTQWSMPITVIDIVNEHLKGERDLLLCQDELIEAGFERWARL